VVSDIYTQRHLLVNLSWERMRRVVAERSSEAQTARSAAREAEGGREGGKEEGLVSVMVV